MIKLENVEIYGWEAAIRGMRNPMNSWAASDSYKTHIEDAETLETRDYQFFIGEDDLSLMKRLAKSGPDHGKFMRMIGVSLDIVAPLYWWKEFDTYKVGTVSESCSTMHKIHEKEFVLDDFGWEHLLNTGLDLFSEETEKGLFKRNVQPLDLFTDYIIPSLNKCREAFLETNDKKYWWQMIQLLPMSYNYRRTVTLNYAVLRNMYHARKNHKLDEWRSFCEWIESLPYSELITEE